jgi:hypothetical protein
VQSVQCAWSRSAVSQLSAERCRCEEPVQSKIRRFGVVFVFVFIFVLLCLFRTGSILFVFVYFIIALFLRYLDGFKANQICFQFEIVFF